jgi:hypothetical protein
VLAASGEAPSPPACRPPRSAASGAPALARVEATRLARAGATLVTLGDVEYPRACGTSPIRR